MMDEAPIDGPQQLGVRENTGGWIKVHRCLLDHPRYSNGDWLKLWLLLLLKATHRRREVIFGGRRIVLKPGQMITSRSSLATLTCVEVSKVERLLAKLESEHAIEQQGSNSNRLITILNWNAHQQSEQAFEQPSNSKRTANEHLLNTNKKEKKAKNDKERTRKAGTPAAETRGGSFSDEAVQTLYNAYPKKAGVCATPAEAKEIRKALLDLSTTESAPIDKMLERIGKYAHHVRSQPREFVKTLFNYCRHQYYLNEFHPINRN